MIFYHREDLYRYVLSSQHRYIGITSGCFDLLHPLHVEYLNKCRRLCDELYVLIDSDRLININKNKWPLINEMDRAFMVDNQKSVNGTMIFDNITELENTIRTLGSIPHKEIRNFKHHATIYGNPLEEFGGNITNIIVPDIIRFQSTTEITNHLKQE